MLPFVRPELALLQAYSTPHFPDADRLDANELAYDLPEPLKSKLAYLLEQSLRANRYPDGDPLPLRAALAEYTGLTAEQVSVGNGSDELIRSVLIATCLGSGGRVLSAEPTFSMYRIVAETLGITYVGLPRAADYSIDPDALAESVARHGVRVVFVANPNSPTGNLHTPELLARLRELPVLTVIDEAYYEFAGQTVVPLLAEWPNLLVLRTFSKAFRLANFRVGYALGHPELIAVLEKLRLPYNLPGLSQLAATTALEHRDTLLAVIPEVLAERERIAGHLRQIPGFEVLPSDANFLFIRTADPTWWHRALAERGSLVRVTGGGLRITVGTPEQNDRLLANLAAIS